jgi:hypothetical protein
VYESEIESVCVRERVRVWERERVSERERELGRNKCRGQFVTRGHSGSRTQSHMESLIRFYNKLIRCYSDKNYAHQILLLLI